MIFVVEVGGLPFGLEKFPTLPAPQKTPLQITASPWASLCLCDPPWKLFCFNIAPPSCFMQKEATPSGLAEDIPPPSNTLNFNPPHPQLAEVMPPLSHVEEIAHLPTMWKMSYFLLATLRVSLPRNFVSLGARISAQTSCMAVQDSLLTVFCVLGAAC